MKENFERKKEKKRKRNKIRVSDGVLGESILIISLF